MMEGILGIIGLVIIWVVFRLALSAGSRTIVAVGKSAFGQGSFSENMELQFRGMPPLSAQLVDSTLDGELSRIEVKQIEVKGLFPVQGKVDTAFIISIFDHDEKTDLFKPVLSIIDHVQEPESAVFQQISELGFVEEDQGFPKWVRIGGIIPEFLQPPLSGHRTLIVVLRLIDVDDPPTIMLGRRLGTDGVVLWERQLSFSHEFTEKGYEEAAQDRDEARSLAISIGMAVAMSDGTLDDTEGDVLKNWITKEIAAFSDNRREALKEKYNDAMKSAYAAAKAGNLSLSDATARLNEIGEKKTKYDAIELCFDIMAADGVADPDEMKTIRKVADALELDLKEIEKLRDQKIVGLDASLTQNASAEDLIGIDPSWSNDQIKQHLRSEFQKWNNRLNSLPEGDERENAQRMLDLVAEARKKYG